MSNEESERITTSQDVINSLHDKIDYQEARIAELESQLATAQPAAQGMDAQTIKHISALGELARMPNAEYFADAHNAAVRHLRALAAQAKQGEKQ